MFRERYLYKQTVNLCEQLSELEVQTVGASLRAERHGFYLVPINQTSGHLKPNYPIHKLTVKVLNVDFLFVDKSVCTKYAAVLLYCVLCIRYTREMTSRGESSSV